MNNNNDINNTNSQPDQVNEKKIQEQETHEASAKTAHLIGKGFSTYYGKGVGGEAYEIASKTKPVQALESQVGKRIEKLTGEGGKKAMNFLNKSGALDAADEAITAMGTGKGGNSTPGAGTKPNVNANKDLLKGSPSKSTSSKNKFVDSLKSMKKPRQLVTPPKSSQVPVSMDDINPNDIEVPEGIEDPDAYRQEVLEQLQRERLEQQMIQEEMLREQQKKEAKRKKQKENAKKILELIKKDPKTALIIIAVALILLILFILIYMIASDMDLVGTQMSSYDQAEVIGNASSYCDQITLVKEHPDFTGDAVSSIDDVDLTETFVLNRKTVNRWSTTSYDLESYIKGVVQAEAINVDDEKTFEVASIAARTYALQITNSKCHTWDNANTRESYRNPQNFTTDTPDTKVTNAVNTTSGLVITLEDKLLDMENGNYYDYFCNIGKTREREDYTLYQMLQKNEEERLLIPIEWAKENNAEDAANFNKSGKYDGACQKEGMSLFGAKYLLNEKSEVYTTLRILRYYYGHQTEIKKVSSIIVSTGCYYWPTTSTTITSFFGPRTAPIAGASTNHGALDIGVARNSDVYATTSGTVIHVTNGCSEGNMSCGGGYGNYIKIDHGGGLSSLYAHLSSPNVSVGDTVTQGQVIAASGNTGRSTGPHLHFEIRVNDVKVDPLNYVSTTNTRPTNCGTSIGGGAIITNDNVQSVCLSLKNIGYSNEAIAAVLTNLSHENGAFDPTVRNSIQCLGIAQWCYYPTDQRGTGRLGVLESLANYMTLQVQINFMIHELNSNRSGVHNQMLAGGSTSDLTYKWCMNYEVPGESYCITRKNDTTRQAQYLQFSQNGCN